MTQKKRGIVLTSNKSTVLDKSIDNAQSSKGIAERLLRDAMRHTGGVYGLLTLLAGVVREGAGTSDPRRKALAEKVAKSIERAIDEA